MKKFEHLRSFPLNYEISKNGKVRKRTDHGFIYFKRYSEDNGVFVDIEVNGKVNKCLLAEILLLTFEGNYLIGDIITYKDGNINNVITHNLKCIKAKTSLNDKFLYADPDQIGIWRCYSRASSANRRYSSYNQIITPNEVLRCLQICLYRCFYCNAFLNPKKWHLDHFVPMSKGGKNEYENLRASCTMCNMMKSDMEYVQFVTRAYKVYKIFLKHNPDHTFLEPKAVELIKN